MFAWHEEQLTHMHKVYEYSLEYTHKVYEYSLEYMHKVDEYSLEYMLVLDGSKMDAYWKNVPVLLCPRNLLREINFLKYLFFKILKQTLQYLKKVL